MTPLKALQYAGAGFGALMLTTAGFGVIGMAMSDEPAAQVAVAPTPAPKPAPAPVSTVKNYSGQSLDGLGGGWLSATATQDTSTGTVTLTTLWDETPNSVYQTYKCLPEGGVYRTGHDNFGTYDHGLKTDMSCEVTEDGNNLKVRVVSNGRQLQKAFLSLS